MSRKDKAVDLKHKGYNCCQAVLCAYADEMPLREEDLMCIGAAYGVGMGCMEAMRQHYTEHSRISAVLPYVRT